MKKIDAQALKGKHRLELVMQEFGERFEIRADRLHCITTPGLFVNVDQQIYEYQPPGMAMESGDLLDWLKKRFSWSFRQALRYLEKRSIDPEQEVKPGPETKEELPAVHQVRSAVGEYPDLSTPADPWQEKALAIGGEEMREYFTRGKYELLSLWIDQPSRFVPVQDLDIENCSECGQAIDWWWTHPPQLEYQQVFTPGATGISFRKVRVIEEPQVYAFEYEQFGEMFCVCETCKRKKINFSQALGLLYKSACRRHSLEPEKQGFIQCDIAPRV